MSEKKHKKKKVVSDAEDTAVYVVEDIRDKKVEKGKTLYFVKWKDWPEDTNTWEPVSNLDGCPELLEEFERAFKARNGEVPPPKKKKAKKSLKMKQETNGGDSSVYDSDAEKDSELKTNSIDVDVLEECPPDREPDELLGVVPISGIMTYLVRWKPKRAGAAAGEQDMNLVKGDVFKDKYPNIIIAFYEAHIIWSKDDRLKNEVVTAGLLDVDKLKARKQREASVSSSQSKQRREDVDRLLGDSSGEESERGSDDAADMEVDPTVR